MTDNRPRWCSPAPKACDLCGKPVTKTFIDGKVRGSSWACMCRTCWAFNGVGLGTGKGQRYDLDKASGLWLKTGG